MSYRNQAKRKPTAVIFTFRSNSFNLTNVQLNFQHNICLHKTKFTPTVMYTTHMCTLTPATVLN